MHSKLLIVATVAALSLATTAFAGEGNGEPFPLNTQVTTARLGGSLADTGAAQYPAANPALALTALYNVTAPVAGQEAPVESENSLPVGALSGTVADAYAQSVNRYFGQQSAPGFAQARVQQPAG